MINNLEDFKAVLNLMVQYRLDCVKVNGIEILKTKHEPQKTDAISPVANKKTLSEEELMMYSTSAPSLTPEQIESLSYSSKPSKRDK